MGKTVLLKHLKSALEAVKAFMGNVAQTVADALTEMDKTKADKPETISVQVPNTGWLSGSGVDKYPLYYDIASEDVTEADLVIVDVDPSSADTAKACGLEACKTVNGAIRLMARLTPSAAIKCEYKVIQGKEVTE